LGKRKRTGVSLSASIGLEQDFTSESAKGKSLLGSREIDCDNEREKY